MGFPRPSFTSLRGNVLTLQCCFAWPYKVANRRQERTTWIGSGCVVWRNWSSQHSTHSKAPFCCRRRRYKSGKFQIQFTKQTNLQCNSTSTISSLSSNFVAVSNFNMKEELTNKLNWVRLTSQQRFPAPSFIGPGTYVVVANKFLSTELTFHFRKIKT